ncbi:MAG: hypothetical protein SFY70_01395 [Bacteroidia bacterium]|nr:hypothetical protein [Bacteroidia bacterium]
MDLFDQLFGSVALVVCWLMAVLRPNWLGQNNLGAKNAITKRSAWMRREASRFGRWFLIWTALPAAGLSYLYDLSLKGSFISVYVMVGVVATYLYSRRLKRQWNLWQQLGYDGPPKVEEQRAQLTQTSA